MQDALVLSELGRELGISESANKDAIDRLLLIEKVNVLIATNFEFLVSILYRIDVSEKKLAVLLEQHPDKIAAEMIVDLMIERQAEKIKSREDTKSDRNISEEEKW